MGKTCFETVRNLSGKADYENRSKKRTQDFSRNRKMPFPKLTRRVLSLARGKVKREAFRELFRAGVEGSCDETIKDWRGILLPAIDSSHIAPPPDAASRECRGATARASILRGIESDIGADTSVERLAVGERSLAKTHIEALGGVGPDFGGGSRRSYATGGIRQKISLSARRTRK